MELALRVDLDDRERLLRLLLDGPTSVADEQFINHIRLQLALAAVA